MTGFRCLNGRFSRDDDWVLVARRIGLDLRTVHKCDVCGEKAVLVRETRGVVEEVFLMQDCLCCDTSKVCRKQ